MTALFKSIETMQRARDPQKPITIFANNKGKTRLDQIREAVPQKSSDVPDRILFVTLQVSTGINNFFPGKGMRGSTEGKHVCDLDVFHSSAAR